MPPIDNNKEHNQDKQREQGKGPNSPSVKLPEDLEKIQDKDINLEGDVQLKEETTENIDAETGKVKVDKVNPTIEDVENNYDDNVPPSIKAMKDTHKWGL